MRLGDLDALKEVIEKRIEHDNAEDFDKGYNIALQGVIELIDNAQPVSDRYDEGFRDGYAQCINDKEERKENNRLFQKGGAK